MLIMLPIFALVLKLFYAFSGRYLYRTCRGRPAYSCLSTINHIDHYWYQCLKGDVHTLRPLAAGGLGWMITVSGLVDAKSTCLSRKKRFFYTGKNWPMTVLKFSVIGMFYMVIISVTVFIGLTWSIWRS